MCYVALFPYIADEFKDRLKLLYDRLNPTQISQEAWPPAATRKVFQLAMIKSTRLRRGPIPDEFIQMTITGRIDDILRQKCPIKLEDIFSESDHEGKCNVVLLEGGPGCGKSTLSVHISQQWGEGKLFTKFKYVILVQLRDPAIQTAKHVGNILPARDKQMRQQAANDIIANDGEGVLFILDGWDELPSELREKSFFRDMIQPGISQNNTLLKSAVIVTSRPIASVDLHQCASTRIEILGFTPKELENYFTKSLKDDNTRMTLETLIHENPVIASTCYLPMNASILVHLCIADKENFPTTQYGIFSKLVLCCMYRHDKKCPQVQLELTSRSDVNSLQEIPEKKKKDFLFLCELAYQGIMEDRVIFSNLPEKINTLGLIQGVESFVTMGKALSYNFLHLSIQETLAGYYIATQLSDDKQVTTFNQLFDQPRFSTIFQFYAAITKLQKPGIKDIVSRIATEGNTLLLCSLFHCLYEAKDLSLCEFVAQQLQHRLCLIGTILTPSDCFCIGYFLSQVCKSSAGKFRVDLISCGIGDQSFKSLVNGLHRSLDNAAVTTLLTLNLSTNAITHCVVKHITTLLDIGCIEDLDLSSDGVIKLLSSSKGNQLGSLHGIYK